MLGGSIYSGIFQHTATSLGRIRRYEIWQLRKGKKLGQRHIGLNFWVFLQKNMIPVLSSTIQMSDNRRILRKLRSSGIKLLCVKNLKKWRGRQTSESHPAHKTAMFFLIPPGSSSKKKRAFDEKKVSSRPPRIVMTLWRAAKKTRRPHLPRPETLWKVSK